MAIEILTAKLSLILCYALLFVTDNAGAQGSSLSSTDISATVAPTPPTTFEPVTETSQSCMLPNIMDMYADALSNSTYHSSHLVIHLLFIPCPVCPTYCWNVPLRLPAVAPAARLRADPRLRARVGIRALPRPGVRI